MIRKKKPVKIPPSEDDIWLDLLHTEVGKAMARWLKGSVNLERQIKTLSAADFKGMAAAAEAQWIRMVVARMASVSAPMTEQELASYSAITMG